MTCKGIARLLSERQDHRLSFPACLAVRVHVFLCVFCRRFKRQLEIISQLSRAIGGVGDGSPCEDRRILEARLSSDAKSRMRKALAREKLLKCV